MENMDIGESIKFYRKKRGLTQSELAKLIGKSESSVQKYENDLVEIPLGVLDKVSMVLGVNKICLLGLGEEEGEACKYCTGKDRDRENLIDDKYIDLYVAEDKVLTVWMEFSSPGLKINIEAPIEYCPKCGRKL